MIYERLLKYESCIYQRGINITEEYHGRQIKNLETGAYQVSREGDMYNLKWQAGLAT